MERWRWRCWWREWWSCSSSRRRRSALRRKWSPDLRGRGVRAYQQVDACLPAVSHIESDVVHSLLLLRCLFSGGAGSSTWHYALSRGGTRVQIWRLCTQRRTITPDHESTGSLKHLFSLQILFMLLAHCAGLVWMLNLLMLISRL